MTLPQKTIVGTASAVAVIVGAWMTCLNVIDRSEKRIRESESERTRTALTIQSIQKDYEKLDGRQWKDWTQLAEEQKAIRQELSAITRKLLELELKPK